MTNTTAEVLEVLTTFMRPSIPINVALWDIETIAAYLHRSPQVVRERIVTLPGFPDAIRLPTSQSTRARGLWEAKEVIAWAKQYKGS